MTGIANVIVGFWLLPVTLFILLPLAMLFFWLVFKAVQPILGSSRVIDDVQDDRIVEHGLFNRA